VENVVRLSQGERDEKHETTSSGGLHKRTFADMDAVQSSWNQRMIAFPSSVNIDISPDVPIGPLRKLFATWLLAVQALHSTFLTLTLVRTVRMRNPGRGVIIYVLDTGMAVRHQYFQGRAHEFKVNERYRYVPSAETDGSDFSGQ